MVHLNINSLCILVNKTLMVVSKILFLFCCFLLFCQYGKSQEQSVEESKSVSSLVDSDENEHLTDLKQEYEEAPSRLKLKFGFKRYSLKETSVFQVPLLLEFQLPMTTSGNFKWLFQSGLVQTEYYKHYSFKTLIKSLINDELFSEPDFNREGVKVTRSKTSVPDFDSEEEEDPLFLFDRSHHILFQMGFQYELGVQASLLGGVVLGGAYTIHWVGNFTLGVDLISDILNMEIGLEKLYNEDHSYWGVSIAFGFYIKEWT